MSTGGDGWMMQWDKVDEPVKRKKAKKRLINVAVDKTSFKIWCSGK